jgi:transcriptional regulator with XRE-family HTH domain
MAPFGERLQLLRKSKGMSRYRLAQLSGISKEGMSKLEEPGADPKLSTINKLAAALGVSPAELVGGPPQSTAVDRPPQSTRVDQPSGEWASGAWSWHGDRMHYSGDCVWEEEDDEWLGREAWEHIQDAYDAACAGEMEDAIEALDEAQELVDAKVNPSLSRDWNAFAKDLWWALDGFGTYLKRPGVSGNLLDDFAAKLAKKGKLTPALQHELGELFECLEFGMNGHFHPGFCDKASEGGEWEEEREARKEAGKP